MQARREFLSISNLLIFLMAALKNSVDFWASG
jgi:hypothetical protein